MSLHDIDTDKQGHAGSLSSSALSSSCLPPDEHILQSPPDFSEPKDLFRYPYPSPPQTNCLSTSIPLPGSKPSSSLDAGPGQFGGILDSPLVDIHAGVGVISSQLPISPPPTLPTVTASLPYVCPSSSSGLGLGLEDAPPSDVLPLIVEEDGRKLILETEGKHKNETHLLSPLSPESSFGFGFGFGSLDTLFEDEDEDLHVQPPHSLYEDLVVFDKYNRDVDVRHNDQGSSHLSPANRPPYPSPDLSPEFMTTLSPSSSLHSSLSTLNDVEDEYEYQKSHYDFDDVYDAEDDVIGTQSPSLRTFGLPELDQANEDDLGEDLGVSMSLSSFPSDTTWSSASLSSPLSPSSLSPSHRDWTAVEVKHFDDDNINADHEIDLDFDHSLSSTLGTSLSQSPSSNQIKSLLLLDSGVDVYSPASSFLSSLECETEKSRETFLETLDSLMYTLSNLEQDADAACPFPVISDSETFGSLSYLPSSAPTSIPASLEPSSVTPTHLALPVTSVPLSQSTPLQEATRTLLEHVELRRDLCGLLLLRRKARERMAEAKARETEVEMQPVPVHDQSQSPTSLPAQVQASSAQAVRVRAGARKERKREKERWKEIGSLVHLTLLGPRRRTTATTATAPIIRVAPDIHLDPTSPPQSTFTSSVKDEGSHKTKLKPKPKVSITSLPQLVARMILRRRGMGRDSSSSSSYLNSKSSVTLNSIHDGLPLPCPLNTRPSPRRSGSNGVYSYPYVRSPLWQCMTVSYVSDGDLDSEWDGMSISDNGEVDDDDDDDLGLGLGPVGLRLKGFGSA